MFGSSQADIDKLLSLGKMVVCYIDVGTAENYRPDYALFPADALGNQNGWPGELYIDIRNPAIKPIMQARFALAASKKCTAVEPDNEDAYTNDSGFPLTYADQIAYNTWVANTVHSYGMKVALKNDQDQTADLIHLHDFAIVESCVQYDECSTSSPFIQAGKQVFETEYKGKSSVTTSNLGFCSQTNKLQFSSILKTLDLDALPVCSCLTMACTS